MSKFSLEPGEAERGSWTTNLLPHGGGRYTGKLTVTDRRVIFQAQFDTSLKGTLDMALLHEYADESFIIYPRDRIREVATRSGFLKKQVHLTLDDGQVHVIDNGMLSVDQIVAALA